MALLASPAELQVMTPLQHLEWARSLPQTNDALVLPAHLQTEVDAVNGMTPVEIGDSQTRAESFWRKRKHDLQQEWEHRFKQLPLHVRQVRGIRKNLLLLEEMMKAAECTDLTLTSCLMQGFPIVGRLPRSGSMVPCPYGKRELSIGEDLARADACGQNDMMARVRGSQVEPQVAQVLWIKCCEEVATGKAAWLSLEDLAGKVLTPRFPVDEGVRISGGVKKRKVRAIDDFLASKVNAACCAGELIEHDTLDTLLAMIRAL